jgi:hypothetical protein
MKQQPDDLRQQEYDRRKRVLRFVHRLPGPQEPPRHGDYSWLKSN